MKRLLLSQGRTGSYNLTRYIKESNGDSIKVYREPFNTTASKDTGIVYKLENLISEPNSFIENKIGKGSLPLELQKYSTDELMMFLKSKFDIIGILTRKNLNEQTESVLNAKLTNNWMSQYVYKDVNIESFPEFKTLLSEEKEQLNYISENYNVPIFYYENLYLENQKENLKVFCNFFNIKFDEEIMMKYMDKSKKYRIDKSEKLI